MKKFNLTLIALLCLLLTGCSNEFARQESDSNGKISQESDRYSKVGSMFSQTREGYSLTVSKFDGRETLWKDTVEEDQNMDVDVSFSISKGQAKIVHIDEEGNVTTVIECFPDTSTDGFVTKTISLKSGKNRLKIVGYDCEDIDLQMQFAKPE